MRASWRSASPAAGAAAVPALGAACGQDGGSAPDSRNAGATAAPGGVGAVGHRGRVSAGPSAPTGELPGSANGELGELVTDGGGRTLCRFGGGRTLCRFDRDSSRPPRRAAKATAPRPGPR